MTHIQLFRQSLSQNSTKAQATMPIGIMKTWVKYCCAAVLPTQLFVSKNVYIWLEGFARDPVHTRFRVRAKKPAVAISVQIVLTHRCRFDTSQPVYTVAFVEQLTALLAIWWVLLLKISQLCSRRFMVRAQQNLTIREYWHNDVFFDEYILSKFYLLISLSYVDYLKMFYF